MKCRVQDAECGTDAVAILSANVSLGENAYRLTQIVIDMLDLQMVLDDEFLVSDEMKDGARVLTWNWLDGCDMPIVFTFTE
jgi:hypothetical protein